MGKRAKEKAATAAVPTPAADIQKAEELVRRLEFLGVTVGQQIDEQVLRMGQLLGELETAVAKAAKPAADAEKQSAYKGLLDFDDQIESYFMNVADLGQLLFAMIFHEIQKHDRSDEFYEIVATRIENAVEEGKIGEEGFLVGIFTGMRFCRD